MIEGLFWRKWFVRAMQNSESTITLGNHDDADQDEGFADMAVLDESLLGEEGLVVLMIDDNKYFLDSASTFLGNRGMKVICAENGAAGVELFMSHPENIDIILMDIEMPAMGGIEAALRIREAANKCAQAVPIIAVTGSMFSDDPNEPLFHGKIRKPFELERLTVLIKKTLLRTK